MLVPELDVAALATSSRFYAAVLEFRTLFERSEERFAYLERDGVELMIQEAAGRSSSFTIAGHAALGQPGEVFSGCLQVGSPRMLRAP
jgi:hypothetical protein